MAFYFLKILLYTQLKSIQSHNISTILAHGDASKKYEINNHEMTLVTAAMTLIIFIEKNDFQSNFQILVAIISTLYFSVFAYGAFIIIQQFESVFDSFESELPIQTSLLIGSYRYWGILGLISAFILFKVSKCKSSKSMNVLIWLAVLSLLLIAFSIWGIYSPVLEGNGQT